MNLFHALRHIYFWSILVLSSYLCVRIRSDFYLLGSFLKFYEHMYFARVCRMTSHIIPLDLLILVSFCEVRAMEGTVTNLIFI
jgi:hypothetical protein